MDAASGSTSSFQEVRATLPEVIDGHALTYAEKTAIRCGTDRVTWAELGERLSIFANFLSDEGVGPGDNVVILGSNKIDTIVAIFGTIKSGGCAVPLSGMLASEQLDVMIADAAPKFVVATKSLFDLIEPVRTGNPGVIPEGWIALDFSAPGWRSFFDIAAHTRSEWIPRRYDAQSPCIIIYSSGTTGLPKGIVHSHHSRYELAHLCALEMRFAHDSVALTTTAVYSMGTFLMMLPVFFTGATLVVMEKFTPGGFIEIATRERISHSFMVPSQFLMILTDQPAGLQQLGSLKCLLSAGSPLRAELKHRILREMTPNLYELYGCSEGFATVLKPEQQAAHGHTVGAPLLGYLAEIVDASGNVLSRGEVGEIVGFGGSLMTCYNNRPAETASAIWYDSAGRNFLRTGDIGSIDEHGFLSILDRKKDMIISGGFNVFPVDIERILASHEAILDCAVIGVPHPKWDETPYAFVILKDRHSVAPDELREWINARVSRTQRISGLQIVLDLPRNALGKVLKRELRERYSVT
ncbi:MAG: AMP-dependent synthetase and ligase [Sphingomonas bacterium]|nr:AMP-dependent synthetase and ligase [Sphingomonas bacterium]